jgi:transcriptional regulator with XRE-family HTH domain
MSEIERGSTPPSRAVPPEELGRRLRAARTIAGFDRMTDFATAIAETTGVSISARSLYAMERGEQMPSFEQMICILAALPASEQLLAFDLAIKPDIRRHLWFHEGE